MATSSCSATDGDAKVPVVLRVKRKRTDDPAETLVVKKFRKLDDAFTTQNGDSSSVFHFVETFSKHDITETEVLDRIKSHKPVDHSQLVKKNPFSELSISERKDDRRDRKKVSSQGHRFKVVSQHRNLVDSDINVGSHQEQRAVSLFMLELEIQRRKESKDSTDRRASTKELMTELVHLYDIVQEEEREGKGGKERATSEIKTESKSTKSDPVVVAAGGRDVVVSEKRSEVKEEEVSPTEEVITCNSIKMVRETRQTSNGELVQGVGSEYVYDLYYSMDYEGRGAVDLFDWDSLCVHDNRYGIEMFDYSLLHPSSVGAYDDDEDSNDEDNWRNDYPDEEQLFGSDSDEEGAHSRMAYRYRDGYDDYIFDDHDNPYLQDTSYWSNGEDGHDSFSDWR